MRKIFAESGFSGMTQCQILEYMLFFVIPRKDTNPIAQDLLSKFGSLAGVLEANTDDLLSVDGIGKTSAEYIKMFHEALADYSSVRKTADNKNYSFDKLADVLKTRFSASEKEIAILICLDKEMQIISFVELTEGNSDNLWIDPKKVAEAAIGYKSSYVILAHNHPGATPIPSKEDINATLALQPMLKNRGIELIDHLIFSDEDFISFIQSGLLKNSL